MRVKVLFIAPFIVIPAKAGIQGPQAGFVPIPLDPGFRQGDGLVRVVG